MPAACRSRSEHVPSPSIGGMWEEGQRQSTLAKVQVVGSTTCYHQQLPGPCQEAQWGVGHQNRPLHWPQDITLGPVGLEPYANSQPFLKREHHFPIRRWGVSTANTCVHVALTLPLPKSAALTAFSIQRQKCSTKTEASIWKKCVTFNLCSQGPRIYPFFPEPPRTSWAS